MRELFHIQGVSAKFHTILRPKNQVKCDLQGEDYSFVLTVMNSCAKMQQKM